MDIYEFINSSDIRNHCKAIKYKFNPLECAFLVWQSFKTLKEKRGAYQYIINNMPDMKIENRYDGDKAEGLHNFLEKYVETELFLLQEFERQDGGIYCYSALWNGEYSACDSLYADWEVCVNAAVEYWEDDNIKAYKLLKRWTDRADAQISIYYNENKEPVGIYEQGILTDVQKTLYCAFEDIWIKVPTPFEKGDIVYVPNGHRYGCPPTAYPFVLTSLCTWNNAEEKREIPSPYWDMTDMTAYGCFQNEVGKVYSDCMHSYIDLEYYRDELSGSQKALKALSSFLKNQIDVSLFMNAYHIILQEENAKEQRKYLGVTDDHLAFAGLL